MTFQIDKLINELDDLHRKYDEYNNCFGGYCGDYCSAYKYIDRQISAKYYTNGNLKRSQRTISESMIDEWEKELYNRDSSVFDIKLFKIVWVYNRHKRSFANALKSSNSMVEAYPYIKERLEAAIKTMKMKVDEAGGKCNVWNGITPYDFKADKLKSMKLSELGSLVKENEKNCRRNGNTLLIYIERLEKHLNDFHENQDNTFNPIPVECTCGYKKNIEPAKFVTFD